jgi:hypothetical protein
MLSGLIMRPSDVRSVKTDEAVLRGAIHTTRRLDNRHWVEPILDAAPAERRGSVAEAQRKSGSRRACSEERSFSSGMIQAVGRLPPFRVCGIFQYYFRGNPHSLVRDRRQREIADRARVCLFLGVLPSRYQTSNLCHQASNL